MRVFIQHHIKDFHLDNLHAEATTRQYLAVRDIHSEKVSRTYMPRQLHTHRSFKDTPDRIASLAIDIYYPMSAWESR